MYQVYVSLSQDATYGSVLRLNSTGVAAEQRLKVTGYVVKGSALHQSVLFTFHKLYPMSS